jgi:hypothetical protein
MIRLTECPTYPNRSDPNRSFLDMKMRRLYLCVVVGTLYMLPVSAVTAAAAGQSGGVRLSPVQGLESQLVRGEKVEELMRNAQFMECLTNTSALGLAEVSAEQRQGWPRAMDAVGLDRFPPDTISLILNQVRMDLVRRSAFITTDGTQLFLANRGGVIDQTVWFGPLQVADFQASCVASGLKAEAPKG